MSLQRYNPYAGRPGIFTARNARTAYNLGRKIGEAAKKYTANKPKGTPINVAHKTTVAPSKTGRGFKKVHKDTITSKHAKKAIQNVVKQELNKEIELKKAGQNYVDISAGLSHRVWYTSDLASQLGQGDGQGQYSGDKVHLSSVKVRGWVHEQLATNMRGLPTRIEFMLVQRKGNFAGTSVSAWGGGMWSHTPEDQIVKSDTAADNTIEGRFAEIAPSKRRFTVLAKKVITMPVNKKPTLGTVDNPPATKPIDFTMKIDKTVKPFGLMSGEEVTDLPRIFLCIRAFQGVYSTYGSVIAAAGQFGTQLFFRDA